MHQFPLAKLHLKVQDTELGLYLSYASLGFTSTPCGLLRLFILLAAYSQSPAVSVPPNTDADAQLDPSLVPDLCLVHAKAVCLSVDINWAGVTWH